MATNALAAYTCSAPQPASASLVVVSVHFREEFRAQERRDSVPHVGRRLNRGNEFERGVDETDERKDGGGDVLVPAASKQDAAHEEVDCVVTC